MTDVGLGRIGLWTGGLDQLPVPEARTVAAEIDGQGWGALWIPEAYGREAFVNAAMLLAASPRITLATGIANIYGRDPITAAGATRLLADQFPGRFVLGLGVSHAPMVEQMRGHRYASPAATMRGYLEALAQAPYAAVGDARPPVLIAALGPKMLEVARECADGIHPYLVVPERIAQSRQVLGPDSVIAVEQGVTLSTDRSESDPWVRDHLEVYTGLPNYRNSWLRQGFDEQDLVPGGSPRLQDAMVVRGPAAIQQRVQEHFDAGADHVCLQILGPTPHALDREQTARLAELLL
ncbi:MAG TPA: TIGR03620 family F420-dependent LLM class oxidoreductase [Mycobacteriales bacterium]|jgi:probable F420-dependent oxidoreductase|nr:TIGR03620 family F420-dependent LLM class oxidoreductase [Mycobacteriales bacterium]